MTYRRPDVYSQGIDLSNDTRLAIGMGRVKGATAYSPQGYATSITQDAANPEVMSPDVQTVYPSNSGEAITVVSSAADTSLIRISGLDENFDHQVGYATLDGTTPVTVLDDQAGATLWSRINETVVLDVATVGTVTVEGPSGVLSYALSRDQVSVIGRYSVGRDTTGQVMDMVGSMIKDGGGANAAAVLSIYYRLNTGPFYRAFGFAVERRNSAEFVAPIPQAVEGVLDLEFRAYADASSVDAYARSTILLQTL